MPAYWIARAKINDPVEYKKYTDRVPAIVAAHGGKVLARGGKYRIMEGPETFHRFIVIEFPTMQAATGCFESRAYQDAAKFRRGGAGVVENVIVEGGDATPR
jgi:uncharacterized protein (DUF1330 family)